MVADAGAAADALVWRGREVQVAGLCSPLVRLQGRRFGERVGPWEEQELWSQTD